MVILSFCVSSCKTLKSHNADIVLHPDQYVIIADVDDDMIEIFIPEKNGMMTYYGWTPMNSYKGWTLVKKTY